MTEIIDADIDFTNIAPTRRYVVATDGACRGNPGPGGGGAMLTSLKGKRFAAPRPFRERSGTPRTTRWS